MRQNIFARLLWIILVMLLCVGALSGCTFEPKREFYKESGVNEGFGKNIVDGSIEFLNQSTNEWENLVGYDDCVFSDDNWKAGYKKIVYFRVKNVGNVEFDWTLNFAEYRGDMKITEAFKFYFAVSETELIEYPENKTTEGYEHKGYLDDLLMNSEALYQGQLGMDETAYFAIMLEMDSVFEGIYDGRELSGIHLTLTVN